jgi:hypothetical protein
MARLQTSPALSCPSAEDIGAFVEGSLNSSERSRLISHLASCEECRDDVAEIALLRQEEQEALAGDELVEEEDESRPSARRSPLLRFPALPWKAVMPIAAAALVVLAVGPGLYRRFLEPSSFDSAFSSLPPDELQRLAPRAWTDPVFRSGQPLDLESRERAFRAGVRTIDLQIALEANAPGRALAHSSELVRVLGDSPLVEKARFAFYENLNTVLKAKSASTDLPSEADKALAAAQGLEEVCDTTFLLFGQWAEAGRLAALAEDSSFFERAGHLRFLNRILEERGLDPDVAAELRKIDRIWQGDSLDSKAFRALAQHFGEVISFSAGKV